MHGINRVYIEKKIGHLGGPGGHIEGGPPDPKFFEKKSSIFLVQVEAWELGPPKDAF